MTRSEAAKLLTLIASFDGRPVDEAGAAAWAEALRGLDFRRCWDAVITHHRKSEKWIKPAHIWELARTTTDGDAAPAQLTACEQGSLHSACDAVHHPDEPCTVLERRPERHRELVQVFKPASLPAPAATPDPEPTVHPDAAGQLEAERRRQLAALDAMGAS